MMRCMPLRFLFWSCCGPFGDAYEALERLSSQFQVVKEQLFSGESSLPEKFIIYRNHYMNNGDVNRLKDAINALREEQKIELTEIVHSNQFTGVKTTDKRLLGLLDLYKVK